MMRRAFLLALLALAGPALAQPPTDTPTTTPTTTPTGTPTQTPTITPTRTPAREEKVTTYRLQRACSGTRSIEANTVVEVCVAWPVGGGTPTALGADPGATCVVEDDVTSAASVTMTHQKPPDQNGVCAVLWNRDPLAAHSAVLCCTGYRWGTTPD